jgi:CubicO group peptidase (beta-lactamase class C family)
MTDLPDISGHCPPRFSAVKDAFAANFTEAPERLNEQAARFSVIIEGETVVDLWAGHADAAGALPMTGRTLIPVFSTGKVVMALLMASAVERGKLAYEEKVAHLWAAFAANGKGGITVAQLLSHQAGLPGFSETVDPSIWFDRQAVLDRLAAQAPMWLPGTGSGYHPITVGYLANEVFRLADGRTMGRALAEDFSGPFGLDLWIGLPEAEHDRVASLRKPSQATDLGPIDAVKKAAFLDRGSAPGDAARRNGGRSRSRRPTCTARPWTSHASWASSPMTGCWTGDRSSPAPFWPRRHESGWRARTGSCPSS